MEIGIYGDRNPYFVLNTSYNTYMIYIMKHNTMIQRDMYLQLLFIIFKPNQIHKKII